MDNKGFFAALFDFSFSEFITTKIIKIIYAILIVLAGIVALLLIGVGFNASKAVGVIALIFSPVVFIIYVIFARLWLEVLIVVFKIAEHAKDIALNVKKQ
jgi:hypothetical protein